MRVALPPRLREFCERSWAVDRVLLVGPLWSSSSTLAFRISFAVYAPVVPPAPPTTTLYVLALVPEFWIWPTVRPDWITASWPAAPAVAEVTSDELLESTW